MRRTLLRIGGTLVVAVIGHTISAAEPGATPTTRAPFQRLMDAVTFHLSFDSGSMLPDMAEGPRCEPQVSGTYEAQQTPPLFAPSPAGKGLVLGTGHGVYPRAGNLPLERCGAIALWVKPVDWQRPNGANVVFMMTRRARLYLQRQGPLRHEDGRVKRHEAVQFLVKASAKQKLFTTLTAGIWENGVWHLLVANWSWPNMALSVNGAAFSTTSLPGVPEPGFFDDVLIGARSGDGGLLDEVFFFRRPLSLAEARLLYARGVVPVPGDPGPGRHNVQGDGQIGQEAR